MCLPACLTDQDGTPKFPPRRLVNYSEQAVKQELCQCPQQSQPKPIVRRLLSGPGPNTNNYLAQGGFVCVCRSSQLAKFASMWNKLNGNANGIGTLQLQPSRPQIAHKKQEMMAHRFFRSQD